MDIDKEREDWIRSEQNSSVELLIEHGDVKSSKRSIWMILFSTIIVVCGSFIFGSCDLFLAGSDSSSTTLVWAMTELIRHPKVMQKAQLEVRKVLNGKRTIEEEDISKLPYLNQVIKETLRLHPTGPLLVPRLCRETVELAGYTIPVESRVVINAWAIMRDPKYWEDPEIFRPERFEETALDFGVANFEYIPFGGGRRICPGVSFALASMELWLAQLLFYFDWELPGGRSPQELDVEEAFGLTLTRKNDLCLVATYHE